MGGDLAAIARAIIDEAQYMTLATADADGTPWASPVWFAPSDHREFVWISSPEVRHSQNIAARAEIAIVIFDSRVTPGQGQAVYMQARAERLEGAELERGMEVFSRHSIATGAGRWTVEDASPDSGRALYRAVAEGHWVLDHDDPRPGDHRIAVEL